MVNFGKALRHAQINAGVSNVTLAKKLGVYPQQVSVWRSKDNATLKLCDKICNALDIDIKNFVEWARDE
jgi:DNA-binding XRE family transcriptional regulator